MPSVFSNRFWNRFYVWKEDGDEWNDQANYCHQPYDMWKRSLVDAFILNNIDDSSTVMEIAPGHGRWTQFMVDKAKDLILVELNPKCIKFCKEKFSRYDNINYFVNDGRRLDFVEDDSVDFVWSYDSFVHMEEDIITSYFKEFSRVLRPGGKAVIHHSGRKHSKFRRRFIKKFGRLDRALYEIVSLKNNGNGVNGGGFRSDISKYTISDIANSFGLKVASQVQTWGENGQYDCKKFGDYISEIVK